MYLEIWKILKFSPSLVANFPDKWFDTISVYAGSAIYILVVLYIYIYIYIYFMLVVPPPPTSFGSLVGENVVFGKTSNHSLPEIAFYLTQLSCLSSECRSIMYK